MLRAGLTYALARLLNASRRKGNVHYFASIPLWLQSSMFAPRKVSLPTPFGLARGAHV